jgi:hypothetical protein
LSGRATTRPRTSPKSVALLRELGAGADTAVGLGNLGWMALLQNDLDAAANLFEESLALAWDTALHPIVLTTLEGLACVFGAKGEARRAAQLWRAVRALQTAKGIPRDTDWLAAADARISDVRSSMGERAWEEAARIGRGMTLEEAVALGRELDEGG